MDDPYVNWNSNSSPYVRQGRTFPKDLSYKSKKYIFGSGKRSGHSGNQQPDTEKNGWKYITVQ